MMEQTKVDIEEAMKSRVGLMILRPLRSSEYLNVLSLLVRHLLAYRGPTTGSGQPGLGGLGHEEVEGSVGDGHDQLAPGA